MVIYLDKHILLNYELKSHYVRIGGRIDLIKRIDDLLFCTCSNGSVINLKPSELLKGIKHGYI